MRVTLKKAAALATALASVGVAVPHTLSMSTFDDAPTEFDTWQKAFEDSLNRVEIKWATVYMIRDMIGEANKTKINSLLTERASVDKLLAVYESIPLRENGPSSAALGRLFEATRGAQAPMGRPNNPMISIELETASLLQPRIDALKARKRGIEDALASWNHDTSIVLPEDVVAVLRDFKLI